MQSDVVRDVAMLLAGVGALLLNYLFAFRPQSLERYLADWFKGGDFYNPDVVKKRYKQYKTGSIFGFLWGAFFITFALIDLLRIMFMH